jgi:phage tail tape-measure protein
MSRTTLEDRVAALERQVSALLAGHTGAQPTKVKDWRRTRGAFTGDVLMRQVFEEGRRIRKMDRKRAQARNSKKRQSRS